MKARRKDKAAARLRRALVIRNKIKFAQNDRVRLSVFRTARHLYAQLISEGQVLSSASTLEASLRKKSYESKCAAAQDIGRLIAERGKAKGIEKVVFDRAGFIYHGRIKALAEAARASGLAF